MGGGDPSECPDDAIRHRLDRLASLPAGEALPTTAGAVRKPLRDLRVRQTRPFADVDLPQRRLELDLQAEPPSDDLRRFPGPEEVGAVQRFERPSCERLRDRAGLLPSQLVQWRVGMPLPALLEVPVGLAVPHEDDSRHGG